MKWSVKVGDPEKQRTNALVIPVFENRKLSGTGKKLSPLLRRGDCSGKKGQTYFFSSPEGDLAERYLLVGCGPMNAFSEAVFKEVISKVFLALLDTSTADLTVPLEDFVIPMRSDAWKIRQVIQLFYEITYRLETFKSTPPSPLPKLSHIVFLLSSKKESADAEHAIEEGVAIASGMILTKNLANLPPNLCTPAFLAEEAKRFAKKHAKTSVAILEKKDLEALKMGALLSVAQSSIHAPKLITLSYRGTGTTKTQKPIVLVGKGITFDTGGNSLKSPLNMIGMKFDMSGAATIYGVFEAVEKLQLPIHLVGVIPACENMPGPTASRPDDVVTSMSGQTIEILNTDAEGRLILADALTYCERFHPEAVIDIATLTGACVIALGHHYSGLMGNDEGLKQALLQASQTTSDLAWELPLAEEFNQALRSEIADLANIAGPDVGAGSIIGAAFLSHFTKKYPWAHLDIAGTACYFAGAKRGASGRPVPLLVQYLIDYSK